MIKKCYCKTCEKITKHEVKHESTGFERVFFGVFTLGASEYVNKMYYKCGKCGISYWKYPM
jgi:hypothetical protein